MHRTKLWNANILVKFLPKYPVNNHGISYRALAFTVQPFKQRTMSEGKLCIAGEIHGLWSARGNTLYWWRSSPSRNIHILPLFKKPVDSHIWKGQTIYDKEKKLSVFVLSALMGNFRVHMKHAIFLHRIFFTAYRTEVVQHSALLELIRAAEREDSACMKQTVISELSNCMLLLHSTGRTYCC